MELKLKYGHCDVRTPDLLSTDILEHSVLISGWHMGRFKREEFP